MRKSLKGVGGKEKYDRFFNGFLENFFTEKDAKFFASVRLFFFTSVELELTFSFCSQLGLNCIRVPFNYRHFESE